MKDTRLSISLCWLVTTAMSCQVAQADTLKMQLKATIERTGANQSELRRHEAIVENCTLITHVWHPYENHEWTLWTSFHIDLRGLELWQRDSKTQLKTIFAPIKPDSGISIVTFDMKPGFQLRHEMPMYRNPKPPFSPAPTRGNEYDYVYKYKDGNVFLMHEGVSTPDKAETFVDAVSEYARAFCVLTG